MKLKFLFLLTSIILLIGAVTAERYAYYEFKEGITSESGDLTETNYLTNVNILGLICLDDDCNTIGDKIFDLNSGPNSDITLIFPTERPGERYAIYFYKPGYITWEHNPSWGGTDYRDPKIPPTVVLSKKQNCHAPIESFSIINTNIGEENIPIYISAQARLDAETYSALFHNGPLEYIPPELDNYYKVQTEVHLTIYDDQNTLVHFDRQELFIDLSGSQNIQFTWTPTIAGNYKAILTSIITDSKCSSYEQETTSKEFTVLQDVPLNMCYTVLNDLETSDKFPDIGDILTITYNKISNYADNTGILTALPASITYELKSGKDDPNGNLLISRQRTLPSSDTINPYTDQFNLQVSPSQVGWYTIYITGVCESPICSTLQNIQDTITESIYFGASSNHAPFITTEPKTITLIDEEYIYDVDATDQDNDILTYSITNAPKYMIINSSTGLITWTPTSLDIYKDITIRVEDPYDGYDTQTFDLEVVPETPASKKHLFSISSINLPTNTYHEGEIINGYIQIKNIGQEKEKNIAVTASILDLGVRTIVTTNLNLGQYDNKWIPFQLELPYNINKREYLIRIEIENQHHTEIKYLPIYIREKYIFNF